MSISTPSATQRLSSDTLELDISAALGGSVLKFSTLVATRPGTRSLDIFRKAPQKTPEDQSVHETSCFPLLPYSGRINQATFKLGDETIVEDTLPLFHPHAIHGHGWVSAWDIQHQTDHDIRLSLEPDLPNWPWSYRAEQQFALSSNQLRIGLSVVNLSDRMMPVGLGLHPYFALHDGATIQTGVTGMWISDDEVLPVRHIALAPDHPHNQQIRPLDHTLDNVFTGWNRSALIQWQEKDLEVQMTSDTDFLIIYTPKGEDFFCVEPATHAADSFNRDNTQFDAVRGGTRYLNPGETLSMTTEFEVRVGDG